MQPLFEQNLEPSQFTQSKCIWYYITRTNSDDIFRNLYQVSSSDANLKKKKKQNHHLHWAAIEITMYVCFFFSMFYDFYVIWREKKRMNWCLSPLGIAVYH